MLVATGRIEKERFNTSRMIVLVLTSRVKVLSIRAGHRACVYKQGKSAHYEQDTGLVFTSRVKVKNIIVLVATSSVEVLGIGRLLGSEVLPILWQQPMPALAAPVLPAPKPCICLLFNARDGPYCTYRQYKPAHICSQCRGPHPRSLCGRQANGGPEAVGKNSAAGSHKHLSQE